MLSPEDKRTLIEFAGPLFAQSKEIDSMYFNDSRPKTDGIPDSGIARGIQTALERDFALSQARPPLHVQAPMPQIPVPQYTQAPMPQDPAPQYVQAPIPQYIPPVPESNPNQLEFNFNLSEQEKTNALLEAQNKLIKELIKKVDTLTSIVNDHDKVKS